MFTLTDANDGVVVAADNCSETLESYLHCLRFIIIICLCVSQLRLPLQGFKKNRRNAPYSVACLDSHSAKNAVLSIQDIDIYSMRDASPTDMEMLRPAFSYQCVSLHISLCKIVESSIVRIHIAMKLNNLSFAVFGRSLKIFDPTFEWLTGTCRVRHWDTISRLHVAKRNRQIYGISVVILGAPSAQLGIIKTDIQTGLGTVTAYCRPVTSAFVTCIDRSITDYPRDPLRCLLIPLVVDS
ncbi:hypothetical protein EVAR_86843_1 [Eumeta japonica]|uniref:Uncharacterized protein n=1 Tax=Eumeta variegata TaxID=151549 RepID=A0A4C1VT46_EUMVA|nr:hypothetical protein EVAR_86843_1 [Eumeta japonica]